MYTAKHPMAHDAAKIWIGSYSYLPIPFNISANSKNTVFTRTTEPQKFTSVFHISSFDVNEALMDVTVVMRRRRQRDIRDAILTCARKPT